MKTGKKIIALMTVLALLIGTPMFTEAGTAQAKAKPKYKLEISKSRNVVVAYQKVNGKWKYKRTMLCSVGTSGKTPSGTFKLKGYHRWGYLMGPCWGQYCRVITGSYWFHSVPYHRHSKSSQKIKEFNKLGRAASHGCVRLATIDAKWVYKNCKRGTKVKIARKVRVPKGRPPKFKSTRGWDPTDPDKRNPVNKLKKAVISAKAKTIVWKSIYNVKKGVKATNPNALEDITGRIKTKILINGKWKSATKLPTGKTGKVKVKYIVNYAYCKNATKIVTFTIADNSLPTITTKNLTVDTAYTNAVKGVTAKQKDGTNRTAAITVTIKNPAGEMVASNMSYEDAKTFAFDQVGEYKVTYKVANKTYSKKIATKTITITVN